MPRNVRNFWINLVVDGRESLIGTGPIGADGGFHMTINIRQDGEISKEYLALSGVANYDGELVLVASDGKARLVIKGRR